MAAQVYIQLSSLFAKDEIENAKRARKEKKKELSECVLSFVLFCFRPRHLITYDATTVKKFQEMQAKAKEANDVKSKLKDEIKALENEEYPDFSKNGLGFQRKPQYGKPKIEKPKYRSGSVYKQQIKEKEGKGKEGQIRKNGDGKSKYQPKDENRKGTMSRDKHDSLNLYSKTDDAISEYDDEEEVTVEKEKSRKKYRRDTVNEEPTRPKVDTDDDEQERSRKKYRRNIVKKEPTRPKVDNDDDSDDNNDNTEEENR